MEETYDCTADVMAHKRLVEYWLDYFSERLKMRAEIHDDSKLQEPEKSIFDLYTWRLKNTVFGSDEYKAQLAGMGVGLKHHYAANRHHPEHFSNGIAGMTLLDLMEMVSDWKAAAARQEKPVDLAYLVERFGIAPQLAQILLNTLADDYFIRTVGSGVPVENVAPSDGAANAR